MDVPKFAAADALSLLRGTMDGLWGAVKLHRDTARADGIDLGVEAALQNAYTALSEVWNTLVPMAEGVTVCGDCLGGRDSLARAMVLCDTPDDCDGNHGQDGLCWSCGTQKEVLSVALFGSR